MALIQNAGSHENIVKLLDWCFVSSATVMVLEFIDSDLSSFIKLHRGEQRDKLTDVLIKVRCLWLGHTTWTVMNILCLSSTMKEVDEITSDGGAAFPLVEE